MASLSLCMIVKNEEKNLFECLYSVYKAIDEIIVVDTGSTDKTVDIAKSFGAKVYHFKWCDDFSAARNESLKYATCDYILFLDADDRFKEEDLEKLIRLKSTFSTAKDEVYYLKLCNVYDNNRQEECYQIRIFPNLPEMKFSGRVHEQIGPAVKKLGLKNKITDIRLYHVGYKNPELNKLKAQRNLKLLLKDLEDNPTAFVYYYLGQTYLYLSQPDKAEEFFRKTMQSKVREDADWVYITAGIQLANLYNRKGDFEGKTQVLKQLQREFPNNDLIKFVVAEDLIKNGHYDEALNLLLTINPDNLHLMFIPANLNKNKALYYLRLAEAYTHQGYLKLAEGCYQMASQIMPDNYDILLSMGKFLCLQNKFKEATDCFKKALNFKISKQKKSLLYTLLGIIALQSNNWMQAEDYFKEALNLYDQNAKAALHLAEIKLHRNQWEEAQDILERLIKTSRNGICLYVLSMLSLVYAKQMLIEPCVKVADELLRILKMPRRRLVKNLLDLGEIYLEIGKELKKKNYVKESANVLKTLLVISALSDRSPNSLNQRPISLNKEL